MGSERRSRWGLRVIGAYDYTLLTGVVALLILGLVSIYSVTYYEAAAISDPGWWFRRQLSWAFLGVVAMFITSHIPYTVYRRVALLGLLVTLVLLVLVLIIGHDVNGSKRFLFGNKLQPSELAKITFVIYIAVWLASRGDRLRDVTYGLIPFGVILGLVTGLIVLEPDFGTALLIAATGMIMFFVAGADVRQLFISALVGGTTFALLIWRTGYASARVRGFLALWQDPMSRYGTQEYQALLSIVDGGILGRGLGQLDLYLPVAQSDMIFAAIANAFGLLGATLVLALFGMLAYRGFLIAARVSDRFAALLVAGITSWITFQAVINMSVVVGLMPSTGIPLPFVSYGGSSLLVSMAAVGIILHISQYAQTRPSSYASSGFRRGHGWPRVSGADRTGSAEADT